jgi:hypothetical protein
MNCFLCQNEIVYQSDSFKLLTYGRTGHTEIKRSNYICAGCKDFSLSIDFPGEELYSFRIYLGRGYTLQGYNEDVIQIIYSKNKEDQKVTLPWVHVAGIKNIFSHLKNLSEKYEIFVTFS